MIVLQQRSWILAMHSFCLVSLSRDCQVDLVQMVRTGVVLDMQSVQLSGFQCSWNGTHNPVVQKELEKKRRRRWRVLSTAVFSLNFLTMGLSHLLLLLLWFLSKKKKPISRNSTEPKRGDVKKKTTHKKRAWWWRRWRRRGILLPHHHQERTCPQNFFYKFLLLRKKKNSRSSIILSRSLTLVLASLCTRERPVALLLPRAHLFQQQ